MMVKKMDDIGRNAEISKEEIEQEEIPFEVEHIVVELHNPNEVEEDA